MASAEGRVWGGVSPPQPTRESRGALYVFWHILKATKRSFLYLYADSLSNRVLEISKHDKI